MADRTSNERTPEVIPWERLKKMAERDGVDVSDYITSMNAHILNQRDEINKLTSRLAAALSFVPDNVKLSELRSAVETSGDGPLPRQLIEALQRAKVARAKHDAGRVTDLHERDLRFMLTEIERLRGPVKSNEQPSAPAVLPTPHEPVSSSPGSAAGADPYYVSPTVEKPPQ